MLKIVRHDFLNILPISTLALTLNESLNKNDIKI